MNSNPPKSDVLQEAGRMLSEPGKDTKRKILLGMNGAFIAALMLHLVIQLVEFGTLPDPGRDMVFYPLVIILNLYSFIYNIRVLLNKKEISVRKDNFTKWSTLGISMLVALLIVHANANTAMSMLVDFGFSVVMLFIIGTVISRKAAIIWFIISAISLYFAYQNVGSGFEYHLLTQEEIQVFNESLAAGDPAAIERLSILESEKIKPFPASLYVSVWLIFMVIAFLAVYFESNMISKVLGVIPQVIDKINIASSEKNKLQNENLRMGMELDVARKIQKMMLPRLEEFNSCRYLEVAARMDPASEVGGDFYEFLPQQDGSVLIAMGDVTDHGLQSGLVMMMAQSTIRTIIDGQKADLPAAVNRINNILYKNIHDRMQDHRNMTLALARIEPDQVTICGQHENLLHYHSASADIRLIQTTDLGMYIGMVDDIEEHVQEMIIPIGAEDIMLWYTDGLTEAENMAGELYGEARLQEQFTKYIHLSPTEMMDKIYADVYNFTGDVALHDDISVLIIKRKNIHLN